MNLIHPLGAFFFSAPFSFVRHPRPRRVQLRRQQTAGPRRSQQTSHEGIRSRRLRQAPVVDACTLLIGPARSHGSAPNVASCSMAALWSLRPPSQLSPRPVRSSARPPRSQLRAPSLKCPMVGAPMEDVHSSGAYGCNTPQWRSQIRARTVAASAGAGPVSVGQ